jgi:putative component of toxin-antitoxin plasmid stabilization module
MQLTLIIEDRSFTLYSISGGSHNVDEFLVELEHENEPAHAQIMRRLEDLAKHGPVKQNATFKPLREGIFETRAKLGPRVLFFYDANHIVICVCGFPKDSQKTPKSLIKLAIQRKKDYQHYKQSGKPFTIYTEDGKTPMRMPKP